jgi:hypothetical protein
MSAHALYSPYLSLRVHQQLTAKLGTTFLHQLDILSPCNGIGPLNRCSRIYFTIVRYCFLTHQAKIY